MSAEFVLIPAVIDRRYNKFKRPSTEFVIPNEFASATRTEKSRSNAAACVPGGGSFPVLPLATAAATTSKTRPSSSMFRNRRAATGDRGYGNPSARKSSRGSSKLQLPNDVTNLRRYCSRAVSIFQSRHAKNSSAKEN